MAKIVIFPLLTMSSGHHKVAEVISEMLILKGHTVKKIDILSNSWSNLEKSVTNVYKRVLGMFPQSYEALYRFIAGPENYEKTNITKALSSLFNHSMKLILKREMPDFIICTHGFPSSILNSLKKKKKCNIPVANVYTDFFINNYWGCSNIEYHFVSTSDMSKTILLRNKNAIVFSTGIPVSLVYKNAQCTSDRIFNNILITGGSSGYGSILKLIEDLKPKTKLTYNIMCGSNKKLLQRINNLNNEKVKAYSYISDPNDICKLYDSAGLVIGKPGGITISECLNRTCIFYIHSCLPGQEYYNYKYLLSQGLVIDGLNKKISEDVILRTINNKNEMKGVTERVKKHVNGLTPDLGNILDRVINSNLLQNVGG